jgi:hypothetical protein
MYLTINLICKSYVVILSVRKIAQRLDHQKQPKIVTSRPQLKIFTTGYLKLARITPYRVLKKYLLTILCK